VRTSERRFWQADGDIVKELWTGKVVNVQHQDAEQRKPPQNVEAGNSFGTGATARGGPASSSSEPGGRRISTDGAKDSVNVINTFLNSD
jgi:hypothetical protein